jgi:hypothetical protein
MAHAALRHEEYAVWRRLTGKIQLDDPRKWHEKTGHNKRLGCHVYVLQTTRKAAKAMQQRGILPAVAIKALFVQGIRILVRRLLLLLSAKREARVAEGFPASYRARRSPR